MLVSPLDSSVSSPLVLPFYSVLCRCSEYPTAGEGSLGGSNNLSVAASQDSPEVLHRFTQSCAGARIIRRLVTSRCVGSIICGIASW
jgi:hypothetical protein